MKSPPHRKILIIQTAFLGDLILTTGILEKLHKHYPTAKIDILIKKGYSTLFQGHPFVNQILVFDKKNKIKEISRLISFIRDQYYDTVINTHKHLSTGVFTARSGAKYKIGYDVNPMSFFYDVAVPYQIPDGRHEYERLHDLIAGITDIQPHKPKLYVDDHIADFSISKPYICMAPMSIWFTKTYPIKGWIELIRNIPKEISIYLLGGPDEKDDLDTLIAQSNRTDIINTAGEMTMLQSIRLMKYAQMNYTNDSGPLHMASAVNAPTTALFLSTSPESGFGPIADNSFIIETRQSLKCKPCGNHGHKTCPEGHFKCSDITTSDLLNIPKAL